ncbi:GTP-binding protein [Paenibacillus sp. DXFW5]|uniref:GTP-binding protein n=1 Tax=Paenibacillus rhizolycopersici TaxID=2780073 RepID=A0ABS2H943_9BACL|nr:GTP-binding protein [Paenibacillus rhizolycopersici]MBM6997932.1 GTP-binding protein [Paenibacillus rhizolycopersici]
MNMAMKIPVVVLSGFLGSGKTTLLIKLLEEAAARGLKPGVLMNELGKRDIDGELISRSTSTRFPLEKMLDGCICCTKKDEIQAALTGLLQQDPDLLLLELTGVANPEEIVEQLAEPGLLSKLYLHRVITLVDAEHALEYNSLFASDKQLVRTLRSQLSAADDLIINKTDLIPPVHSGKVTEMVRKYNAEGQVHYAVNANIPLASLFSTIRPVSRRLPQVTAAAGSSSRGSRSPFQIVQPHQHLPATPTSASGGEAPTSYSRINTISLPIREPLQIPVSKLERFIKKWSPGLLRAKGYVRFSQPKKSAYLMQYSGKRFNWEAMDYDGPLYLVLIGYRLPEPLIAEEWAMLR